MKHALRNFGDPMISKEIYQFINEKMRWRALMITRSRFDTDDIVQETFLRWLRYPEYESKDLAEKIKLARAIMNGILFHRAGLHYKKQAGTKLNWRHNLLQIIYPEDLKDFITQDQPENIDYKNLLFYMKERNDIHINCFWLYYIGYPQQYIAQLYGFTGEQIRSVVNFGKKKMQKIIAGMKVAEPRNWKDRKKLVWEF